MRIARPSTLISTTLIAAVLGAGVAVIGVKSAVWSGWVGFLVALVVLGVGLRQTLRRWRVARRSCPQRWAAWLARHVPLYAALSGAQRNRFERDVRFFLDEHTFEGVQDVTVTDDLRLGVAAGAALVLHGRPDWELEGAQSFLFYPDRFDENYYGGDHADFDGMAHEQGPILLSAKAVKESWMVPDDGSNVVLHELAHLFDFKNTGPDGMPSLMDPRSEKVWSALVQREMERIRQRDSLLRPYAATAPSEFFAVAVEVFFEQPHALHGRHPALFEALRAFFNLDPRPEEAPGQAPKDRGNGTDGHVTGPGARTGEASK